MTLNGWFIIRRMIQLSGKSSLRKQRNFKYPSRFSAETTKKKTKKNKEKNKQIKTKQATKQTIKNFPCGKKTRIKQTKTQTDFCARLSLNGNKIIKRLCYIEESRYFNTDPARMRKRLVALRIYPIHEILLLKVCLKSNAMRKAIIYICLRYLQ